MNESIKGNMYILAEMVLWSLFPIVSLLGLSGMASITSLFWVNLFATIFFLVLMFWRGKWKELGIKKVWYYTFGVVFFICVMLYGLYFIALPKTTPTNASIVALFEIVPTYFFFHIIRKEAFKKSHILGVLLAVIGTLIVLLPNTDGVHSGDWLILFAIFFPPIGNWFQQKARQIASAESILFLRHALSSVVFLVLIFAFGGSLQIEAFKEVFGWLLLNGVVIFGLSKVFWVEAIHRMSVTRALAITSVGPIFTAIFSWIILGQAPTITQLLAIPFLVASICILTNISIFNKKTKIKLILASNGAFLTEKGYFLLGIPFSKMRVGYVTTASKGSGSLECRQGKVMQEMGIHFETYDIGDKTFEDMQKFFADKNLIHVEGGDTCYLLNAVRKSGFKKILDDFFERGGVYLGTSAGSYIMGPSIETTFWKHPEKNRHGLTDLVGLEYVPFMFFAHYKPEMFEAIREKKNSSKYPVKILKDGQGIFVEGSEYTFIGEGEEVIL